MKLDDDAAAMLAAMRKAALPRFETLTPQAARDLLAELRRRANVTPPEVARVIDVEATGRSAAIPLRIYRPTHDAVLPAMIFFHGGGFVVGSIASHDVFCRRIAAETGCAVVSVEYRLAPEHAFPAGLKDAIDAIRWVAQNAVALGFDPARIVYAGDSAGANFAAVAALMARDGDLPAPRMQLLIYPVTDLSLSQASHGLDEDGLAVTGPTMVWFREHYLAGQDAADWRASPLRAPTLAGVAPCLIVTAGADPLCDEGLQYAARLAADGVRLTHLHFPGQMHGFLASGIGLPRAASTFATMAAAIRGELAQE